MIKYSRVVNIFHCSFIGYLLGGFMIESQRPILVALIPTLQFQFLVNKNECILTQLENKICSYETGKNEKSNKRLTFVGKKLTESNINISYESQVRLSNIIIYSTFLLNYWLMNSSLK